MGADVEMKDGADKEEKKTAKEETPVAPQDVLDVVRASRVPDVGSVPNRVGNPDRASRERTEPSPESCRSTPTFLR